MKAARRRGESGVARIGNWEGGGWWMEMSLLKSLRGGGCMGMEVGVDSSVVRGAGLLIERSRVRIPAGAAGEFSSPGSTFCADSYFGVRSTPVLQQ